MKEFYYFLRNAEGHPVVTVCLAIKHGKYSPEKGELQTARGISICSPHDTACKKEGKRWARKRVMKAFGLQQSKTPLACDEPVKREEALETLYSIDRSKSQVKLPSIPGFLLIKSVFNPVLEEFETKILKEDL